MKMVNTFKLLNPLIKWVIKLAGLAPKLIEIEPGTLLDIWVPTETSKNKPVVVFIHGFAGNGIFTWLFQAIFLSGTYSVYVPNLIFFGESTTDKPDRTTAFQADCLARGLYKLGVKKCIVVGLSYGGIVGFKLAKNYPDLVESMVVCGTVMEMTESITTASLGKIGVSSWPELALPNGVEGVIRCMTVGTYKLPWLPHFFYTHFLEAMFDNRKERNELLKAMVIRDRDAIVPNYTQIIHLLWGEDDKLFNLKVAQNLKEQLGGSTSLEYIKRTGHLLPLERPFVYNQRLTKIITSLLSEVKQI